MPGWALWAFLGFVVFLVASRLLVRRAAGPREPAALAKLLATEVKLYNEEALEQARQRRTIRRDLAAEIDRARQLFEQRIPPQQRGDHFERALVEVLAKGDVGLMGEGEEQ